MNVSKKNYTEKRTFHLSGKLDEQLLKYCAKKNKSTSDAVRGFVEKGLAIESYTEEQDMLRKMIREELMSVQEKQIERLIKLELKSAMASGTALFLLLKFIGDEYSEEASLENILANAKHMAHVHLQQREQSTGEYIKSAKEMVKMSKDITKVNDS